MILLDTGVLIANPLLSLDADEQYGASVLSRAELEFGVTVSDGAVAAGRRRRLQELDELFDWLVFTAATSRAYGILAKALHADSPAQARRIDTYIAAHALELGVPLLTTNPRDFGRIGSLVDILPWRP